MPLTRYADLVAQAVKPNRVTGALAAAAIFEVDGRPVVVDGVLHEGELPAIGVMIAQLMRELDPLARMLDGGMVLWPLDERVFLIGIAARCVFVVAVLHEDSRSQRTLANKLRDDIELEITRARADFSAAPSGSPGSGGSSSGPAELPVIEIGITVPRRSN
jgi:hypothetical protein